MKARLTLLFAGLTGVFLLILPPPASSEQPESTTGISTLRLNEVLFFPSPGLGEGEIPAGTEWVELHNPHLRPISVSKFSISNKKGDTYLIPSRLPAVPPGAFVLVLFDGAGAEKDAYEFTNGRATLHTDKLTGNVFDDGDGACLLRTSNGESPVDRVAWGDYAQGGRHVNNMPELGAYGPVAAGQSIGRNPDSDTVSWVIFPAALVSPGAANPIPGPVTLVPLKDSIFREHPVSFAWRNLSTKAKEHHLQVDDNPDFSSPEISTQTVSSRFTSDASLPAGKYYWRTRAADDRSLEGTWSEPSAFTIAGPAQSRIRREKNLGVDGFVNQKDTKMLCLHCAETGENGHAWNASHPKTPNVAEKDCDHCYHYCARASVKMVNRFFGGTLTQDEISYHIFKGETDNDGLVGKLGHGRGFSGPQVSAAILFAFDPKPVVKPVLFDRFERVTESIDAGFPIVAVIENPGHVVVVSGYKDFENDLEDTIIVMQPCTGLPEYVVLGKKLPGGSGQYEWEGSKIKWLTPIRANYGDGILGDPDAIEDFDLDDLVDLDEERFGTLVDEPDTDRDGLNDGLEIRAYRFGKGRDLRYWSNGWNAWKNKNTDGDFLEDGQEDLNRDGDAQPEEYDPFFKEFPFRASIQLAGADLTDGRGPFVSINGKHVGMFKSTGFLAGYHHREITFEKWMLQEPGEPNLIKISIAGFDDIQVKDLKIEDRRNHENPRVLLDHPDVYHLGNDTLEKIESEIKKGKWYDPNGLGFWEELYGAPYGDPLVLEFTVPVPE